MLWGCFFFDVTEYNDVGIVGFASDTTAILFRHNWEETGRVGFGNNGGSSQLDLELMLVDVRFRKVYWASKIKNNYGEFFRAKQWNDSTIIIAYGKSAYENRMLWTIGNSKPQEITLNWNTEKENIFAYDINWLHWENDFLVAGNFIIDTETKTVNKREVITCSNWWGMEAGSGCLVNKINSCGFTLLSEKKDTLSDFAYAHGCDNFKAISIHRYFIEASLGRCNQYGAYCYEYPIKLQVDEYSNVMIRYDGKGNISKEPSFWYNGGGKFVNSIGNAWRY